MRRMEPSDPGALDPLEVERRFAEMLEAAGLPSFGSVYHDPEIGMLELTWDHGVTLHVDLTRGGPIEPLDEWDCRAILGLPLGYGEEEPVYITVPGSAQDPRADKPSPGVVIQRVPPLHPDDVTVRHGIPVTSPSRTLIDLAEVMTREELREAFARARDLGLLDPQSLHAARARVEWRPSLAMLDEIIAEFCDEP